MKGSGRSTPNRDPEANIRQHPAVLVPLRDTESIEATTGPVQDRTRRLRSGTIPIAARTGSLRTVAIQATCTLIQPLCPINTSRILIISTQWLTLTLAHAGMKLHLEGNIVSIGN